MDAERFTTDTFQLRRVQFVPAQRQDTAPVPKGVDIIVLNGTLPEPDTAAAAPSQIVSNMHKKELFREQDVTLHWKTVQRTGAGLQNLGNTCFMNSVLQCLTHTPPLAEALLAGKQLGSNRNFDPLRLTQQQVINALQNKHNHSVAPTAHAKSLRQISKSFRLGRQEDAHEYLVALLDAMHESYLNMCRPKPSPELSQTSMIYRIFAGKICSQVKCTECGHESNTYDTFLDLSLEINRASDLTRALQRFTGSEYLDGANKYICPKQKRKVRAAKCMTVEQAPAVLVIQLKRFEFSMFGHKINKKVDFGTDLDLRPYMSNRRKGAERYSLYGVLVHSGHSVHSGHYFAFVKGPNGLWHQLDDNHVSQVSERVVLAQKAYILFYIKIPTNGHSSPSGAPKQAAQPANGIAPLPQAQSAQPANWVAPLQQAQSAQLAHTVQGGSRKVAQPEKQRGDAKAKQSVPETDKNIVYGPHQKPGPGTGQEAGKHTAKSTVKGTAAVSAKGAVALPANSSVQSDSSGVAKMAPDILRKKDLQEAVVSADALPAVAHSQKAQPETELAAQDQPHLTTRKTQNGLEAADDPSGLPQQQSQLPSQAQSLLHQQPSAAVTGQTGAGTGQTGAGTGQIAAVVGCKGADTGQTAALGPQQLSHQAQQHLQPGKAVAAQQAAHVTDPRNSLKRKSAAEPDQQDLQHSAGLVESSTEDGEQKVKRRKTKHAGQATASAAVAGLVSTGDQFGCSQDEEDGVAMHMRDTDEAALKGLAVVGLHGGSPTNDGLRRSGGTVIFHSPQKKWHGRSWSRFNLHNSIHHSRQLHLADLATSARQQSRGSVALPNRAPELGALPTNMQTQDLSTDTVTCGGHPTAAAAAANTGKSAITANGSDPNTDIAHGDEDSHSLSAAHPEAVHIPHACSQQAAASAPSNAAPVSADRAALQPAETQVPQPAGEGIPQSATRGFTQPGLRLANGNSASPQQGRHQQAAVGQTPAEGKGRVAVQSVSGKDLQIELLKPVAAWGDVDADLAKQAQMLNRDGIKEKRRKVDNWNSEYDKGRVKKLKSKRGGPDAWQQDVNVFMKASQHGKPRGFGGKRSSQQHKQK